MDTNEPGATRPPVIVVDEGHALTVGAAADTLRRLVTQGRNPRVEVRPDLRQLATTAELRTTHVERFRRLGDVVWQQHTDAAGQTIALANTRTGQSWIRNPYGDWAPDPRPGPLAGRIAALIHLGGDQVDAIAALLRRDLRPWRELLDQAATEATTASNGVWVRAVVEEVAGLMYDTGRQPHRIVRVVDDVEACAASWYADAASAADPAWAVTCRQQGARAEAIGVGEFLVGAYPDRAAAALEVARRRSGGQRPGQSWRVEPVGGVR